MFLNLSKLKKNSLPPLKSLRPVIFDSSFFWFLGLALCLLLFITMAFIGFNFFYSQYFGTFKKADSGEDFSSLINVDKLKKAVENRNNFINSETALPKDPSI